MIARPFLKAAAFAAVLLAASPALAGPVSLKADVSDADGQVTLGDLFDGAGSAASLPVATRTGATVVLDAQMVQGLARRAGLTWDNPQGLRRIVVRAGGDSSSVVSRGNVEVLAYARSLSAGEIVQPQDLVWIKAAAAPSDGPRDADAIIGQAARRPLREGSAVSLRDVSAPQVIKSGELVTVTWSDGAVSLTMQGKAMSAASTGQSFPVQNPTSKKIIEAVAAGPGHAVSGPEAQRLKGAGFSQYAAR